MFINFLGELEGTLGNFIPLEFLYLLPKALQEFKNSIE